MIRSRLPLVAPVGGFAAFVLAKVLEDALPSRLVGLQRLAEAGHIHPENLAEVTQAWVAIQEAGAVWSQWRASVDGSAEGLVTEMPAGSSEIDTRRAADLLAVTPSRVRQLARNGALPARKLGPSWLLDRTSVELFRECNGGKF